MRKLALIIVAAILAAAGTALAASDNSFAAYYGNTFISHHADGVEYRVFYNQDRTFRLFRNGGPDRSANFDARGAYTVESNGHVCFTFQAPAPQFPACVDQDVTKKAGESWDFSRNPTARHSLVKGQVPPDKVQTASPSGPN